MQSNEVSIFISAIFGKNIYLITHPKKACDCLYLSD